MPYQVLNVSNKSVVVPYQVFPVFQYKFGVRALQLS